MNSLPPQVLEALRKGDKIVAVKLLRESAKLGLAEAKGVVDRFEAVRQAQHRAASSAPKPDSVRSEERHLSPGEVPRSSSNAAAIVLIVLAAVGAWLYSMYG